MQQLLVPPDPEWSRIAPTFFSRDYFSADRWTFVDPREAAANLSEPLQSICADRQGGRYPTDDQRVREYVQKAVGDETNPYWKFRLAHDAFVEPTLNNSGKRGNLWGRTRWATGLPRDELTTGVAGPSLCGDLLVDGRPYVPAWHCRIPKELRLEFKPDGQVRSVRVTAGDGHHAQAAAPKVEASLPRRRPA